MAAKDLIPWKPGQSGNPSGRPKKLLPRVDEVLFNAKIDPVEEILALMEKLKPREQLEAWSILLSYCQAKPQKHEADPDPIAELTNKELAAKLLENVPLLQEMAKGA